MAKALRDILKKANDTINGVRPSTTTDGSTGKDPGVDYMPKAGDEQDFVAKHSVQKWDDPNGNGTDHFQASNIKYSLDKSSEKHHGYKKPEDKKVNESKKAEDAQCNRSPKGTECPMHGMNECMSARKITEKEVDEAYDDNSSNVSHWSDKKLKFHKEKMTSSSAKAHSELLRRSKTGDKGGIKEEVEDIEELSKETLQSYKKKALALDKPDKSPKQSYNRLIGIARSARKIDAKEEVEAVNEVWTVKHTNGETTKHDNARDALKASRQSPGSKVGATHGARGRKAADVLPTNKSNMGSFGPWGYAPPEKKKKVKEEIEQVDEAGMPASVIKSKQHRANMTNKQFADSHKDKSDADLRSMAWRHGYGKPGTPGHEHYVNRRAKGLKEEVEQVDELSTDLLHRAAHKAAKRAMGDAQGRSGLIFKKYAGMANKFRDKGMSQEKKEKAAAVKEEETLDEISDKLALSYAKGAKKSMDTAASKGSAGHETFMKRSAGHKLALDKTNPEHKRLKAKVGTSNANAKDAAYKKAIGEEAIDELKKSTLGSYINKAALDAAKSGHDVGSAGGRIDKIQKPLDKLNKRLAGINIATKKLSKEEVEQVDEVLNKSTTAGETISDFVHSDNPKFAGKSKEKRKQMALAAYYSKQREQKEDFAQPLLGSNDDSSVSMVKAELKALANKAMDLVMQMPDSMHVEPWCQAKIAQAKAYVNDVHDYMVYGDHKDEEDEQMDTPMTFPNMSVDVNSGRNV